MHKITPTPHNFPHPDDKTPTNYRHSIKIPVFVMQTDCVLFEIGTEFLHNLWILTPEPMVRFQASPRQTVLNTVAMVHVFPPAHLFSPDSIIPKMPHTVLIILLSEGQAGEPWEPSNKTTPFRISGSIL